MKKLQTAIAKHYLCVIIGVLNKLIRDGVVDKEETVWSFINNIENLIK